MSFWYYASLKAVGILPIFLSSQQFIPLLTPALFLLSD